VLGNSEKKPIIFRCLKITAGVNKAGETSSNWFKMVYDELALFQSHFEVVL